MNENLYEQAPVQTPAPGLHGDLFLTQAARDNLYHAARWGKFLAIMAFIVMGLMLITALSVPASFLKMHSMNNFSCYNNLACYDMSAGMLKASFFISFLITFLISFFPALFAYQASVRAIHALRSNDPHMISLSFRALRNYTTFLGVIMVITLVFLLVGAALAIMIGM